MASATLMAFATMVAWGVWAVSAKLATRYMEPELAMVVSYSMGVLPAAAYVFLSGKQFSFSTQGLAYAAAGGLVSGAGGIAYYIALSQGNTAVVTTIGAMYFAVAAVLGIAVLGESITATKIAGIGLAAAAVYLLAI